MSPTIIAAARAGIDLIFAMDFEGADREFQKILAEDPEQPFGYYGSAASSWTKFIYGSQRSDTALEEDFDRRVELSILKSKQWLKRHPRDPYALLALGGSYGLRTRLWLAQGAWFKAVMDGRRAIKATREAHRADPGFSDAYLGIGMWEYYADVFPRLIKALGKFILGGDRVKGVKHLEIAAEKGLFVDVTAKLILIEIYMEDRFGYRDPLKALEIARALRRRFPDSPIFHQIEQAGIFASGDYDAAWKITDEYVQRIRSAQRFYLQEDMPRMHVVYGTIHFIRKQLEAARREFSQAADMAGDKNKPNRWALWGMVRLGEVEDALGNREAAKACYLGVMAYRDAFGFHAWAKRRLSHPFIPGSEVGELPPP